MATTTAATTSTTTSTITTPTVPMSSASTQVPRPQRWADIHESEEDGIWATAVDTRLQQLEDHIYLPAKRIYIKKNSIGTTSSCHPLLHCRGHRAALQDDVD
jgi:hypothetical protein